MSLDSLRSPATQAALLAFEECRIMSLDSLRSPATQAACSHLRSVES